MNVFSISSTLTSSVSTITRSSLIHFQHLFVANCHMSDQVSKSYINVRKILLLCIELENQHRELWFCTAPLGWIRQRLFIFLIYLLEMGDAQLRLEELNRLISEENLLNWDLKRFFGEEGDSPVSLMVFVYKTLFSTVDNGIKRTEIRDNIAGIRENLIEFIENLDFSCELSSRLDEKLVKSFSMYFSWRWSFLGNLQIIVVSFLWSREEKSSSLFIVHFQLISLWRYLFTRTI